MFLNSKGKYESELKPYVREDMLSPIILPELVIDLAQVFSED